MRQATVPDKLVGMKRELMALLLMLAVGLQGSMTAFAATSPSMPAHCQTTAVAHSGASQDSCCSKSPHAINCCLDLCPSGVSATMFPVAFAFLALPVTLHAAKPPIFVSRGDSPLIRPPII